MPRKRDGFVPLGDVAEAVELSGDRALTTSAAASPARRSFTRLDQVTQLVNASEADPELGFITIMLHTPPATRGRRHDPAGAHGRRDRRVAVHGRVIGTTSRAVVADFERVRAVTSRRCASGLKSRVPRP